MAEPTRTRIWLLSGESITVEGNLEDVRTALRESGDFALMTSDEDRVWVNPKYVTHFQEASGGQPFVEVIPDA